MPVPHVAMPVPHFTMPVPPCAKPVPHFAHPAAVAFHSTFFILGWSWVQIFNGHPDWIKSALFIIYPATYLIIPQIKVKGKGKAVPLQAWSGSEGSRKLKFPDFMTTAQGGGKVVSPMNQPPLPPGNAPGTVRG